MPSGAAGVAGSSLPGNKAGNGGAGGAPVDETAGAGGAVEPAAAPCDRSRWSVNASVPTNAAFAIDAMPSSRWTTNAPREPGQWFELTLDVPTRLVSLELHTELYPLDSPTLVHVDVDGKPATFKASTPGAGVLALEFPGELVQTVRIVASDHGAPVLLEDNQPAWWSIYELVGTCR